MKTSTLRNALINQDALTSTDDYVAQLPTVAEIQANFHFYTSYRRLEIEKAMETESNLEVRHFLREEFARIISVENEAKQ